MILTWRIHQAISIVTLETMLLYTHSYSWHAVRFIICLNTIIYILDTRWILLMEIFKLVQVGRYEIENITCVTKSINDIWHLFYNYYWEYGIKAFWCWKWFRLGGGKKVDKTVGNEVEGGDGFCFHCICVFVGIWCVQKLMKGIFESFITDFNVAYYKNIHINDKFFLSDKYFIHQIIVFNSF